VGIFYVDVVARPDYVFHIDATLPVGAIFFVFVWVCDIWMGRSLEEAKMGLEAMQRLGQTVARGGKSD
jgi:hypothetical protein